MSRRLSRSLVSTLLFTVLLATAAWAAPVSAATDTGAAAPSAEPPAACATPGVGPGPVEVSIGDPIAPAYCQADCGVYPDLSVSCSGTCSKADRNCAIGQRGYVTNCSGQTTYCGPACPPCVADCTEGPDVSVSCSGSCTVVDQNCGIGQRGYVQCNGVKTYCAQCQPQGEGCYLPLYPECPQGISCNDDDDCCASFGYGTCVSGTCQCQF